MGKDNVYYPKMTEEDRQDEGPLEQEIRKHFGIPADRQLTELEKYQLVVAWLED